MDTISVEQIVYAPVPYKGYSVRAKSKAANIDSFKSAFREWLIPFDQSVILRGFQEKVIVLGKKNLYLARVFQAQGLDEKKRSGVVSHIAEIPMDLFLQGKILLSSVYSSMAEFTERNGVPIGEIPPLEIPFGFENDAELNSIREVFSEANTRKVLEQVANDKFKLFIINRSYDANMLSYGLARIISLAVSKWIIIAPDFIKTDILFLYDGSLIIGKTLPPWARVKGWSIINLEKEGSATMGGSEVIDSVMKKIYG